MTVNKSIPNGYVITILKEFKGHLDILPFLRDGPSPQVISVFLVYFVGLADALLETDAKLVRLSK